MAEIDQYRGRVLSDSLLEPSYDPREVQVAINEVLLPKFATGIFRKVAAHCYDNGGFGLKAKFGKVGLFTELMNEVFVVTLEQRKKGDDFYTHVSFASSTEEPFSYFNDPYGAGFHGRPEDWSRMIDQVAQGLKRAKREGRHPLGEYAIIERRFPV